MATPPSSAGPSQPGRPKPQKSEASAVGRKVGYARVSTDDQNLNAQLDALHSAGCDVIFRDFGVSGATKTRPGLDRALDVLKEGDTLIVWRLDRLGRSLPHLVNLVEGFEQKGVEFKSLTEAIDTASAGGRLLFHIMAALAEFERSLISERTKAGMQAAQARGQKLGRPRSLTPEQIRYARRSLRSGKTTLTQLAQSLRVHPDTLARAISAESI